MLLLFLITLLLEQVIARLTLLDSCPTSSLQVVMTTSLSCASCPTNQNRLNATFCVCQDNYIHSDPNIIGYKGTCVQCDSSSVKSRTIPNLCQKCPSGIDSSLNECTCGSGQAIIEKGGDGLPLATKSCTTCATTAYRGANQYSCESCPPMKKYDTSTTPYECICDTANGYQTAADTCVQTSQRNTYLSLYPLENVISIQYYDLYLTDGSRTQQTINSDSIKYNYYKAALGCLQYKDDQMCQLLAHMCVLTNYNEASSICQLYKASSAASTSLIQNQPGWKVNYPWLFYTSTGNTVITDSGLKISLSFDRTSPNNLINYYLATYFYQGTLLSIQPMTNQLLLCSSSSQSQSNLRSFGYQYEDNCNLDLSPYFSKDMLFYSLFIKQTDGTFYPVPIQIWNQKNSNLAFPNQAADTSQWQFVKRFFLVDQLSGKQDTDSYKNNKTATILRYASEIKMNYQLHQTENEKIYTPYVSIKYAEIRTDQTNNYKVKTSISTYYKADTTTFWEGALALFITANIIVVFLWILRLYAWTRVNQPQYSPENYSIWLMSKAFFFLVDSWSTVFFYYLFFMTSYWFFFYKLQKKVFTILPTIQQDYTTNYEGFVILFIFTAVFRLISYFEMIFRQTSIDLFFIDWEKPKQISQGSQPKISVWRNLFIANEFNELSNWRYVYDEITIIWFAFFMLGLDWEKAAMQIPSMSLTYDNGAPINFVLKYFFSTALLIIIILVQYAGRKIIKIWVPTKAQEFVNLCTVSNISLFILDDLIHGYYIHGQAPGGVSEGTAEDLQRMLDFESNGIVKGRGLIQQKGGAEQNPDSLLQCFEMYVPYELRQEYNCIYILQINNQIDINNNMQTNQNGISTKVFKKPLPKGFDFQSIEIRKQTLNRHLKIYIEGIINNRSHGILTKSYSQKLLSLPPDSSIDRSSLLFYKDFALDFQKIFFQGNEIALMINFICIYNAWDIITGNTAVSLLLTYVVQKFILSINNYLSQRNLSKKTLLDEKFLI